MPCEHKQVYDLKEHPYEKNCSEWEEGEYYWATCLDCGSTLLRTFKDYRYKGITLGSGPCTYMVYERVK